MDGLFFGDDDEEGEEEEEEEEEFSFVAAGLSRGWSMGKPPVRATIDSMLVTVLIHGSLASLSVCDPSLRLLL